MHCPLITRNRAGSIDQGGPKMSNRSPVLRRLGRAAMFSAARGFAAALGSAVAAILIWWLQSH